MVVGVVVVVVAEVAVEVDLLNIILVLKQMLIVNTGFVTLWSLPHVRVTPLSFSYSLKITQNIPKKQKKEKI